MASLARLVVLSGPQAGEVYEVEARATIGRRPDNDIALRDEHMSRFHALVERRDGGYVLEDLSGKGRTTVDGDPVDGSIALDDHARIVLGRTILRFRDPAVPDVEPSEPITLNLPTLEATEHTPLPEVEPSALADLRVLPAPNELTAAHIERIGQAHRHLETLLAAHAIVSDELDLEKLFERILDTLFETYPAHRAVVMLTEGDELVVRATRLEKGTIPEREPKVSSGIAYRALRQRVGVLTLDAGTDQRFDARRSIVDGDIRSAICAPMLHADEALGVVYLDTLGIRFAFGDEDLRLLTGIAAVAAGAVRNARLVQRLRDTAVDTIYRLALAAEQRDDDTGFHIQRMAEYSAVLGRALGCGRDFCETLRLAAPMHDVGKIGIPDAILKKPGRLTAEEYDIMKQHTVKGGEILAGSPSELLQMAQKIALTHHEKFDGQGYPQGLKGDAIPLEGRIVAVADVFDAILSRRVYKPAFALEKALGLLEQGRGRHFDPEVVEAFFAAQDEILQVRDRFARLEAEGGDAGRLSGPLFGLGSTS